MCRNKYCKLLVKLIVTDDEVLIEPRDPKLYNIYKELIKVHHFKYLLIEKIQLTMVADGVSLKLREMLKKSL